MPRSSGTKSGAGKAAKERALEPDVKEATQAKARTNGHAKGEAELMVDLDFLRGLIEAVDGSGIDNVEIMRAGTRIRISKSPQPGRVVHSAGGGSGSASAQVQAPAAAAAAPAAEATVPAAAPAKPASNLIPIKSPMVGTFFRAPAPEAPPYAEIGSHVSKGQTLCILEAMKLMNELESDADGIVREILVENGEPVEFGQVLFRIEPAGA